MPSTLRAKLGLKDGARTYLGRAPDGMAALLGEAQAATRLAGAFDFMLAFFKSAGDLDTRFPRLSAHVAKGGALWVAWPKGGGLGSDLSLPRIIAIGYRHGMVESKTIAVDATWSAIKFTAPRPGKQYRNSYGQLPAEEA